MGSRAPEVSITRTAGGGPIRLVALTAAGVVVISLLGLRPASAAQEPNSPPVAVADTGTVVSGKTVTLHPLANDSDPDPGTVLRLESVTVANPRAGTAAVVGDDVRVSATSGFVGNLEATYVVTDGTASARGSIRVKVTEAPPPNSPPVAVADKVSVRAGSAVRVDPRTNDRDPDGDPFSVSAVSESKPSGSSVALDGQVVVIRPKKGFLGSLTVGYTITDSRGAAARGTITVTVLSPANQAPVAVRDSIKVTAGRTARIRVLANDRDPDGDRIRLVKVARAPVGTARRAGSRVEYRAPSGHSGVVRLRYRVKDSHGAGAWGTVRVRVVQPTTRRAVELAMARLGLPVGAADGRYDAGTRRAACAWRVIKGRPASRGLPSRKEAAQLVAAGALPRARAHMVAGVNIAIKCQAAFWVRSDRTYRRVMPVSSGKAGYRTRLGTFRVFVTHRTWRYSTIYPDALMYKPMQFSGGQAIHGSATDALVKTYPASHGCVRMLHRDIDALQAGGFGTGSLVKVFGYW